MCKINIIASSECDLAYIKFVIYLHTIIIINLNIYTLNHLRRPFYKNKKKACSTFITYNEKNLRAEYIVLEMHAAAAAAA